MANIWQMRGRRSLLLAAVLAGLISPACSSDGAKDSAGREERVSVGEGLLDPSSTLGPKSIPADSTVPGTGATQAPATTPSTAAKGPANVSTRDDASGFRLRLAVGDHVRFAKSAVIPLRLDYENRSDRVLVVETDPDVNFVIRDKSGRDRWRDADCRTQGATENETPGYGVAPGEQAQTVATYPWDERFGRASAAFNASKCELVPGAYDVFGVLEWCAADQPNEAGPNAANACADGTTKLILSAPVSIEIVDA